MAPPNQTWFTKSLLSDKPCPIGVYRGFEAKVIGEPPMLVEKGQRSPDGLMHVTKVTQPARAKIGRQDIIDSLQKIQKPTRSKPVGPTRPSKKAISLDSYQASGVFKG